MLDKRNIKVYYIFCPQGSGRSIIHDGGMAMESSKFMLGVKEFASTSGLSEKLVRQLCHIEGFPAFTSGVKIIIHSPAAKEWLDGYARAATLSA